MIILSKRAKIIFLVLLFAVIAAAGYAAEKLKGDAFIEESVVREEQVSYTDANDVSESGLININTSDTELLSQLYGIGDTLASRIVDYRENHGDYETIEEIMKVPGISEKKFDEIKDYICAE